jgi:hypothetical protein
VEWIYLIALLWFIAMAIKGQAAWIKEWRDVIRHHRSEAERERIAHIRRMHKANR